MDPTVERVDARQQYEIRVDGTRAGLTAYLDRGGQRVFFHTEVDPAFAGRGLATRLIRRALDDTRAAGLRVVPVCSYVAGFVRRHDEYADIADPVTPDIRRWLVAELA
jgi:uncharacterized protein